MPPSPRTDRLKSIVKTAQSLAAQADPRYKGGVTYFYNLDNHRNDAQVAKELEAMALDKPVTIDLCEVIGNRLPALKGYDLFQGEGPSRGNIACYVRQGFAEVRKPYWLDQEETWTRPHGGGQHPPRSSMILPLGYMQKIVGHQPPRYTDNSDEAQWEGIRKTSKKMAPWLVVGWNKKPKAERTFQRLRPRMLTWDGNRQEGEQFGPDVLADMIGGEVHQGHRIDHAVTRNVVVHSTKTLPKVNGVTLESDHRHALKIKWSVLKVWVPKPGAGRVSS